MPEAATLTLPTTRDEAWRYADRQFLASVTAPEVLTHWTEWTVPAGETRVEAKVYDSGAAAQEGVHRFRVHVETGARFEMWCVIVASGYTRLEAEVTLEEGAHFEFGGVTIGGGDATQEFVTRVIHAQPNATSNQTVRAVQWGRATGNFLGSIDVVRDAQKTDAAQDFKGLLLEKGASVNAVPQLEIFADDVKCAHGATVGQLDEAARYYMATRGIPPELSRKLLVQAFLGDAFVELGDEGSAQRLLDKALDKLDEAEL